ncbi:MAG: 50S ribosomal protein L15 [Verrucomicrobiales bacterium]|nr:50S ribosomal protein L15 [Verrucomicrobiales bacterium]
MRLHDVKPNPGAKHRKRRVGNGESSGLGKTCGKGHKGQKSRSGASIRPNFEGGQMPIFRRLPKKGFNNDAFKTNFAIVNLSDLEAKFEAGDTVNEETLRACGLVQGIYDEIKILGSGELSKSLTVEAYKASASAKEAIEKAGGSLKLTAADKEANKVEKNKKKSAKA